MDESSVWLSQSYRTVRFDPQIQLQFAIEAIHTFVIPANALNIAQVKKTQAKTPVALPLRQTLQSEPASQRRRTLQRPCVIA